MKNTKKVEKNDEYVTKGFLKEILDEAFEKFAEKLAPSFEAIAKRFDRIESTMATKHDIRDMATKKDIRDMATKDDIRGMVTKKDLIQLHDNFVSRGEYNALHARVSLVEETVYE